MLGDRRVNKQGYSLFDVSCHTSYTATSCSYCQVPVGLLSGSVQDFYLQLLGWPGRHIQPLGWPGKGEGAGGGVGAVGAVGEVEVPAHVGPVMELPLSVTSAVRARALPFKLAPAAKVILVSARIFPTSELFASKVAVLTTLHHTLHG